MLCIFPFRTCLLKDRTVRIRYFNRKTNIRTVSIIRTGSNFLKMFLLYVPYDQNFRRLNNYKTGTYNRKLRVSAFPQKFRQIASQPFVKSFANVPNLTISDFNNLYRKPKKLHKCFALGLQASRRSSTTTFFSTQ